MQPFTIEKACKYTKIISIIKKKNYIMKKNEKKTCKYLKKFCGRYVSVILTYDPNFFAGDYQILIVGSLREKILHYYTSKLLAYQAFRQFVEPLLY